MLLLWAGLEKNIVADVTCDDVRARGAVLFSQLADADVAAAAKKTSN